MAVWQSARDIRVRHSSDEPIPNPNGFITACQPFLSSHAGVAGNFFNKHLHTNAYSNGLIPSPAALSLHVYSTVATHEQKYAGGIISRTAPADADAVIMT